MYVSPAWQTSTSSGTLVHLTISSFYIADDYAGRYRLWLWHLVGSSPSNLSSIPDFRLATFHLCPRYFGQNLTDAVSNGTISELRVNDMAVRILAAYYLLNQDSSCYPEVNFNSFYPNDPFTSLHINTQTNYTDSVAYTVAAASHVLLKNVNGTALPLKSKAGSKIVMVGSDAGPPYNGPNGYVDRGGVSGTLAMGWGSG